ncbi:hypothetical protein A6K24_25325 [Metabacillus litoralis]|jgi:hypothetical protein|uniref:Uncharacterized protein n=1 Tax=Metabacillus litoralis TaxID=152268 RepID=A0A179STY0_9BACI|nr:hypothetical protein A6K24_25325 [Metabacillus litoralis]
MEQVKKTIKSSNGKANGAPPALLVLVGSIPTPKFFEGNVFIKNFEGGDDHITWSLPSYWRGPDAKKT